MVKETTSFGSDIDVSTYINSSGPSCNRDVSTSGSDGDTGRLRQVEFNLELYNSYIYIHSNKINQAFYDMISNQSCNQLI